LAEASLVNSATASLLSDHLVAFWQQHENQCNKYHTMARTIDSVLKTDHIPHRPRIQIFLVGLKYLQDQQGRIHRSPQVLKYRIV
jgi:hypothetical protein